MLDNVVPDGQKSGTVNVNLDRDFIKEHGGKIVSSIFRSVTQSVIPEKLELALPTGQGEKADTDEAEEKADVEGETAEEPEVNVAVNFDVVSVVKDLLGSLGTVVAAKRDAAEAEDEDDEEDEDDD